MLYIYTTSLSLYIYICINILLYGVVYAVVFCVFRLYVSFLGFYGMRVVFHLCVFLVFLVLLL